MKSLQALNGMIWRYKGHVLLGIAFIVLTNVFAVWAPSMIGEGVNTLRSAQSTYLIPLADGTNFEEIDGTKLTTPGNLTWLSKALGIGAISAPTQESEVLDWIVWVGAMQAVLFLVAYFIKGIFSFLTRQTIIVMSRHVEYDLKARIYDQYQRLDAQFYRANDTGDLMNRISEDVSNVRMYLGPAIMYSLNLVVLVLMVVGVMWYIDPVLTAFALLPLPFMSLGIYWISANIHRKSDAKQRAQSAVSSFVQQHMAGIRVLKSFHRESASADRFDEETGVYKRRVLELVKVEAMFMPLIVLLVGLSTILTIYVGGIRVDRGILELGDIFQFVFYVNLLTWPFASVGWVTSLVQKAEASMARILDFMEARPSVTEPASDGRMQGVNPGFVLSFQNVSWTYPETGIEAVHDLSFTLKEGEKVGITGRTGSGKSTVLQLAMRIMDPTEGTISLDGTSLHEWKLETFRSHMAYVPQDVFLFSDTIGENIAFGRENVDADDIQVSLAARAAGVSEDVEAFDKGYHTLLGERGVNLSGGQKQRVSIARALIRQSPILLLDDCLSAVDSETEHAILSGLSASGSTTSLMVSHRLSSLRGAERILVLDEGRLVEEGTHESLVEAGGLYATMYAQQQAQDDQEF
ncbi:MAG: ABC transporter ATP-binding protein [Bacteroidetes bacterium]|nr:ABC transporter ATP-binding protein [Bacteroidota bacterium]MDA0903128.1 ABC transporter ATP-binding protein [Bacteroidota bacterium]MDA1242375.1 ABC transporter ATP-binding protein [Bacteroidota bacterium]